MKPMPKNLRVPVITKASAEPQTYAEIPPGAIRAVLKACGAPLGRVVASKANYLVTCKDGFLLFLTVHDERNKQITVSLPLEMPTRIRTPHAVYLETLWHPEDTPEEFNTMDECEAMLNRDLN